VLDGLYQGAAAVFRLAGGFAADRWRRHKEVAAVGYALSAVTRIGFLLVGGGWLALSGLVFVDRTGKGIRTAPRDALISLSSPRDRLGVAFGVHRAFDAAGAMLGPLIAFALLTLSPYDFDAVFVISFLFAALGVAVLVLFVQNEPVPLEEVGRGSGVSMRAVAGLLASRRVRALVLAGSALGLMTVSDGFIYISLQRELGFRADILPLLFVATALAYTALAVPVGRLADRLGRVRIFLGGYAALLAVYALLFVAPFGAAGVVVSVALLGLYYAATDGVLMAFASAVLPAELRASGLALLVTAIGLARLVSSVLFGTLWTTIGIDAALLSFTVGLVVAGLAAAIVLRSGKESALA
jgi:MFS family permease